MAPYHHLFAGNESTKDAVLLAAVLNEVDYGLSVVDAGTRQLLYANAPAAQLLHAESAQPCGLMTQDGTLCTRAGVPSRPLEQALERARMRLRGLFSLAYEGSKTTLAFMPMQPRGGSPLLELGLRDADTPTAACPVLLVFAKPRLCDATTITLFAREHNLSCVEGQVLAQLCQGLRPNDIAERHRVQVSTVRTQMRSIRQKTGASNLRELVKEVAMLPSLSRHIPYEAPPAPAHHRAALRAVGARHNQLQAA
jgi:DNA-binding CsgD family transcriptional regulator